MCHTEAHVILVAFEVAADTRDAAQDALMDRMVPMLQSRDETSPVESWWIAEDDRRDGSDAHSAVFVPMGTQHTMGA